MSIQETALRLESDALMAESIARLTSRLRKPPHPRWRFDDAKRCQYRPWEPLLKLLVDASDSGAPADDAAAPLEAMLCFVRSRYPDAVSLRQAIRDETAAQGVADESEIDVACEPTHASLNRALRHLVRHRATLDRLITRTSRELRVHTGSTVTSAGRAKMWA